jgi:hypothetical protein
LNRIPLRVEEPVSKIRAYATACQESEPATSELWLLFADRIEKIADSLQPGKVDFDRFHRFGTELCQIADWLTGGSGTRPTATDLVNKLNEQIRDGWPAELALQYLDAQRKGRAGRPSTKTRTEGLAVLNLLRRKPNTRWSDIARACCRCGKKPHARKCAERLRAQQRELINFIARLRR